MSTSQGKCSSCEKVVSFNCSLEQQPTPIICKRCSKSGRYVTYNKCKGCDKVVSDCVNSVCMKCIKDYVTCKGCGTMFIGDLYAGACAVIDKTVFSKCMICENKGFKCKKDDCRAPPHFKEWHGIDGYCIYHSKCHKCGFDFETSKLWKFGTDTPNLERNSLCKYCHEK